MRNFNQLLQGQWDREKFVCVGLDPVLGKIPAGHLGLPDGAAPHEIILAFNQKIIDATKDLAAAYKPQSAYYEALGAEGMSVLRATIDYINLVAPAVPVILDAKRADIDNTNQAYINAYFGNYDFDAITLHPYMGKESLQPFLDLKDKGSIILCRTSNPGASEFQDRLVSPTDEEAVSWGIKVQPMPLYQLVAYRVAREWNKQGNCCVVVGATYPQEISEIRAIIGDMPVLIPGVGPQGGDIEATVKAGQNSRGQGMIINSSRGIIYASSGPDFAEAARAKTIELHEAINRCRKV